MAQAWQASWQNLKEMLIGNDTCAVPNRREAFALSEGGVQWVASGRGSQRLRAPAAFGGRQQPPHLFCTILSGDDSSQGWKRLEQGFPTAALLTSEVVLCSGCSLVPCRMFSSAPSLYPLEASSSQVVTTSVVC